MTQKKKLVYSFSSFYQERKRPSWRHKKEKNGRNFSPIKAWNASAPYKVRDVFNICCSCRKHSLKLSCRVHRVKDTASSEKTFCEDSVLLLIFPASSSSSSFILLFLASPSPLFHVRLLLTRLLSGSSQWDHNRLPRAERMKAVRWVTDFLKTHTHTKTHLSCNFYPEVAATMSGVRMR